MSRIILSRSRKVVTATPRPTTTPPIFAATATTKMEPRLVNLVDLVGPEVPQAPASTTSSMALLVSVRRAHRRPVLQT
ncbi:unnamed protein product [Malus baccata var. baccata]